MTLTVRLDAATEFALDRYCAERAVTRSLVVQEALAVFLLARDGALANAALEGRDDLSTSDSANYKAFADAGLIGGVSLGQGADKAAVRTRVAERLAQRTARRGRT